MKDESDPRLEFFMKKTNAELPKYFANSDYVIPYIKSEDDS